MKKENNLETEVNLKIRMIRKKTYTYDNVPGKVIKIDREIAEKLKVTIKKNKGNIEKKPLENSKVFRFQRKTRIRNSTKTIRYFIGDGSP